MKKLFTLPTDAETRDPPAIHYRSPTVREAVQLSRLSGDTSPEAMEELSRVVQRCVRGYEGDWSLYEVGPHEGRDVFDALTMNDFTRLLEAIAASGAPTGEEKN